MERPITGEKIIQVTEYEVLGKLPDPFLMDDGSRVASEADWQQRRRQIYKTAVELQYGPQPPKPEVLKVEPLWLGGKDNTNVYRICAGTKEKQLSFLMTVFLPKTQEKPPVVVDGDLCWKTIYRDEFRKPLLENGIALAVFDRLELMADVKCKDRGSGPIREVYPDIDFGALSAWAWGYSRCVDALEQLDLVDLSCVAFTGLSRGGKTAMLAGVLDERAIIVNPNETNQGSCSCYRIRMKAICEDGVERRSEELKDLAANFPYWLGTELPGYIGRETELPFDAHYLKALVAPRVLLVGEAASDLWTNPIGSWQTTLAAGEVYKFLGKEENLIWYFRTGYHDQLECDIRQLVDVIRFVREKKPLGDTFFKTPFEEPGLIFDWRCPEEK